MYVKIFGLRLKLLTCNLAMMRSQCRDMFEGGVFLRRARASWDKFIVTVPSARALARGMEHAKPAAAHQPPPLSVILTWLLSMVHRFHTAFRRFDSSSHCATPQTDCYYCSKAEKKIVECH